MKPHPEPVSFDLEIWSDSLDEYFPVSRLGDLAPRIGDEITNPDFYSDGVRLVLSAGNRRLFDEEHFSSLKLICELVRSSPRFTIRSTWISIAEAKDCWIFAADGDSVALCIAEWSLYEEACNDQSKWPIFEVPDSLDELSGRGKIYGCIRMDLASWLRGLKRLAMGCVSLLDFALGQSLRESEVFEKESFVEQREQLGAGVAQIDQLLESLEEREGSRPWFEESGEAQRGHLGGPGHRSGLAPGAAAPPRRVDD